MGWVCRLEWEGRGGWKCEAICSDSHVSARGCEDEAEAEADGQWTAQVYGIGTVFQDNMEGGGTGLDVWGVESPFGAFSFCWLHERLELPLT